MSKVKVQDHERIAISIRYKDSFLIANKSITEELSNNKIPQNKDNLQPGSSKYNFESLDKEISNNKKSRVCNVM